MAYVDSYPTGFGNFDASRETTVLHRIERASYFWKQRNFFSVWRERSRQRRELRKIAAYPSGHLLRDMGVTRAEALAEARKHFWQA